MLLPGFHCTVVLISLLCLLSIKPGTAGNNGHYHKQWWKHHNKCPMGASKASKLETLLGDLFPGLFVGLSELTAVVMNTTPPADIDNATTIIDLPEPELLVSTTMEAATHMEPGQVTQEPTTGPGPRANYGCCEIITQVIKPETLRQNGRSYTVVHLNNGEQDQLVTTSSCRERQIIRPLTVPFKGDTYRVVDRDEGRQVQLVTTSRCRNTLARCNTSGRCVNRKGYNWVLVYDLTVNYYPPVRFIPLQINVGCECL